MPHGRFTRTALEILKTWREAGNPLSLSIRFTGMTTTFSHPLMPTTVPVGMALPADLTERQKGCPRKNRLGPPAYN
jgi:hypothetical protein